MHIDRFAAPSLNVNNPPQIQLKSKGWKIEEKETLLFIEKVLEFIQKIPQNSIKQFFPLSTSIISFIHTVPYGNIMRAAILLEDEEMIRFLAKYIMNIHQIPETTQQEGLTYLEMAPSVKTAKVIRDLGFDIDHLYDGTTILIKEITKKEGIDLRKIRRLILAGAEIHSAVRRSAIKVALSTNDLHLLKVMLAANLEVSGERLHEALLFESIPQGKLNTIAFLLQSGAKVNARNDWKETPLFYVGKNIEVLNLLLACGASVKCTDKFDRTSLHAMASKGTAAGITILIKAGADVNASNQAGLVPLHLSANDEAITEALLAGGADPNKKSVKGETPLKGAIKFGNFGVVQRLIKAGASMTADESDPISYLALSVHHVAILNFLIANHVDVNEVGQTQHTALMEAARVGSDEAVTALLDAGADIHFRNVEKKTALMYSIQTESILKRLIAAGADVNAQDVTGATTLIKVAAQTQNHAHFARIARALIDAGAITIMADKCKKKAWHRAEESGNQAIMDMIMAIRPEKLL